MTSFGLNSTIAVISCCTLLLSAGAGAHAAELGAALASQTLYVHAPPVARLGVITLPRALGVMVSMSAACSFMRGLGCGLALVDGLRDGLWCSVKYQMPNAARKIAAATYTPRPRSCAKRAACYCWRRLT